MKTHRELLTKHIEFLEERKEASRKEANIDGANPIQVATAQSAQLAYEMTLLWLRSNAAIYSIQIDEPLPFESK